MVKGNVFPLKPGTKQGCVFTLSYYMVLNAPASAIKKKEKGNTQHTEQKETNNAIPICRRHHCLQGKSPRIKMKTKQNSPEINKLSLVR